MIGIKRRYFPTNRLVDGRTMLNIACGANFHPDWTNIDLIALDPQVEEWNIRKGLPYPDNTFDVVFHSHVLEHLERDFVPSFLKQCNRVVKPGGIIRITTPDLERIARDYLLSMEKALNDNIIWEANYDWMVLELFDQIVRRKTGGKMGIYLSQKEIVNEDFVISRIGSVAKNYRERISGQSKKQKKFHLNLKMMKRVFYKLRVKIGLCAVFLIIGKKSTEALSEGLFRQSGEIHRWLYDRFSIKRLLLNAGYKNVTFFDATTSNIPSWKDFHLDNDSDGNIRKSDSLFVEALKPIY